MTEIRDRLAAALLRWAIARDGLPPEEAEHVRSIMLPAGSPHEIADAIIAADPSLFARDCSCTAIDKAPHPNHAPDCPARSRALDEALAAVETALAARRPPPGTGWTSFDTGAQEGIHLALAALRHAALRDGDGS